MQHDLYAVCQEKSISHELGTCAVLSQIYKDYKLHTCKEKIAVRMRTYQVRSDKQTGEYYQNFLRDFLAAKFPEKFSVVSGTMRMIDFNDNLRVTPQRRDLLKGRLIVKRI